VTIQFFDSGRSRRVQVSTVQKNLDGGRGRAVVVKVDSDREQRRHIGHCRRWPCESPVAGMGLSADQGGGIKANGRFDHHVTAVPDPDPDIGRNRKRTLKPMEAAVEVKATSRTTPTFFGPDTYLHCATIANDVHEAAPVQRSGSAAAPS
jgi:hypothetical protein